MRGWQCYAQTSIQLPHHPETTDTHKASSNPGTSQTTTHHFASSNQRGRGRGGSLRVAVRQAHAPGKKPSPDIEARGWRQGQDKWGAKKAFVIWCTGIIIYPYKGDNKVVDSNEVVCLWIKRLWALDHILFNVKGTCFLCVDTWCWHKWKEPWMMAPKKCWQFFGWAFLIMCTPSLACANGIVDGHLKSWNDTLSFRRLCCHEHMNRYIMWNYRLLCKWKIRNLEIPPFLQWEVSLIMTAWCNLQSMLWIKYAIALLFG